MEKRQTPDLDALLAETATPVTDALHPAPATVTRLVPAKVRPAKPAARQAVPSAELVNLSFKVPPDFRKNFRRAAVEADLAQVDLLAQAFDEWTKSRNK